jgi:hypothetical protein
MISCRRLDGFATVMPISYAFVMKESISFASLIGLMVAMGLGLCGCKSTPKADWNTRVGAYTYDQAIAELGPPDKSAKLSDGKTVAEWIKRGGGGGFSFGVGTSMYSRHSAVGVGQSVGTGPRDHVLRLVFDTENKLASWSSN